MTDTCANGGSLLRNADDDSLGPTSSTVHRTPLATALPACQVLLVEDEGLVAKDIALSLVRLGYVVVAKAATGGEAARLAALFKPHLILMDIRLRGPLDGIATAELIHEQSNTPIIFLTAFADTQTIERAMHAQPFGYLVKPFQEVELRCAIEVAMNRHRTEQAIRDSEQAFRRLSGIDELTGLPNRRGFSELAEQQLKIASRCQQPLVLCFVDLDGLKKINDIHGHAAGDDAIRAAATVLRDTFRRADVVGRLSGDEFAVLAIASSQSCLDGALRRLSDNLSKFNSASRAFQLELSLGAVRHDANVGECLADLIDRADAAMYAQKQRKRGSSPTDTDPSLRF